MSIKSHILKIFYVLICATVLISCKNDRPDEDLILAEAYGAYYLKDDLKAEMPSFINPEDSSKVADQIIENWINQKVILNFAEQNLTSENSEFAQKLEDYKNSLIIYEYERELINQKLDTNISEEVIESYYNGNVDNFKLNSIVVRAWFVKVSIEAPEQQKTEKWFRSSDPEDFDKLYDYCQKYAENFYFEEDNWLYIQELLKEVPFKETNWEDFLKSNQNVKFESGSYLYFVRFFEHKLKGDISPIELEESKIKDLILNKRKIDLLKEMRDEVVRRAYQSGKINKYNS